MIFLTLEGSIITAMQAGRSEQFQRIVEEREGWGDVTSWGICKQLLEQLLERAIAVFSSCFENKSTLNLIKVKKQGLCEIIGFILIKYKEVVRRLIEINSHNMEYNMEFMKGLLSQFASSINKLLINSIFRDEKWDETNKLIGDTRDLIIIDAVKHCCIEGIKAQEQTRERARSRGVVGPSFRYNIRCLRFVLDKSVYSYRGTSEFRLMLVKALYEVAISEDTPETMTIDNFLADQGGSTLLSSSYMGSVSDVRYIQALIQAGSEINKAANTQDDTTTSMLRYCIDLNLDVLPVLLVYIFKSPFFDPVALGNLKYISGIKMDKNRYQSKELPGYVELAVEKLATQLHLDQITRVIGECNDLIRKHGEFFGGEELNQDHLKGKAFPMLVAHLLLGDNGKINTSKTSEFKQFERLYEHKQGLFCLAQVWLDQSGEGKDVGTIVNSGL